MKCELDVNVCSVGDLFAKGARLYSVPLYQREYAWTDEEIGQMLSDLWGAFCQKKRNYYLGTLVVRPPKDGCCRYEVIDGQQRLTTLSLMMIIMRKAFTETLDFANRKNCNDFLKAFEKAGGELSAKIQEGVPVAFPTSVNVIRNFTPVDPSGGSHPTSFSTGLLDEKADGVSFESFILNAVKVFEVTMPATTDAMDYFEVMNNRGEQLQDHELIKAELISRLRDRCESKDETGNPLQGRFPELAHRFNAYWTACSKMDGNLIDHLHASYFIKDDPGHWADDDKDKDIKSTKDDPDESGVRYERQSVLRGFSHFLTHVLRVYVDRAGGVAKEIPLDERCLLSTFHMVDKTPIDPVRFLAILIETRLKFDRFVIKAKMDDTKVTGWRLKVVERYQSGRSSSYKAMNTFYDKNDPHWQWKQNRIVMLESALQVSNRAQRYKEWLSRVLLASNEDLSSPDKIIRILEGYARERIKAEKEKRTAESDRSFFGLGTDTPHLVLNITDYLLWWKYERELPDLSFVLGYANSVEHHHPRHQKQAEIAKDGIWSPEECDEIGNLYMVYSSENSSMSDRYTYQKASDYGVANIDSLPIKRRMMYKMTLAANGWRKDDMGRLTEEVSTLISTFAENEDWERRLKDDVVRV